MTANFRKKLIFCLILSAFLSCAFPAHAIELLYPPVPGAEAPQDFMPKIEDGTYEEESALALYVKYGYHLAITLAGFAAFYTLASGIIMYFFHTWTGNFGGASSALSTISAGLLGTVVILSSYLLIKTLNPEMLVADLGLERSEIEVPDIEEFEQAEVTFAEVPTGDLIEEVLVRADIVKEQAKKVFVVAKQVKEQSACLKFLAEQCSCEHLYVENCECIDSLPPGQIEECSNYTAENCPPECYVWSNDTCHPGPEEEKECADYNVENCPPEPECYAYNNACNSEPQPEDCDTFREPLDCANNGCCWHGELCQPEPPQEPEVCSGYDGDLLGCTGACCHYWHNDTCHLAPETCSDYNGDESNCIEMGCYYWSDNTCHSEPEEIPGATYNVPVIVLKYFPVTGDPPHLDLDITGMDTNLNIIRSKVDKLIDGTAYALEKASKYHGYKNSSAAPSLDYNIVEKKEFLGAMPLGFPTWYDPNIFRPNYFQILKDVNICHYVENLGVKEVWIWGYHHGNLEPTESNMSGPYGDISNSERHEFDMPICDNTYVLYNYNYSRGLGEVLECHTHQIEAVMNHLGRNLWRRFMKPHGEDGQINHCGWTHCPPNVREGDDYNWNSLRYVQSNCEDWHPDGSGEVKDVNVDTWAQYTWDGPACEGSTLIGHPGHDHPVYGALFKIWWMQNIPGKGNNLYDEGKKLINWWEAIGDFDGLMGRGGGLTNN